MDFLNNSDDSNDGNVLKINEDYAHRYDKWRKSEELQKLKDKYGNYPDEETSSTSEEEDDDAVELTEELEKDFFKTLSCLKEKNPKIYDDQIRFFKERPESKEVKKTTKPAETLTMAAYQRKLLLETNGIIEEETPQVEDLPLVEQEKALKESFKSALYNSDSDEDGDGLLKPRVQSEKEKEKEDADYKHWLAGQEALLPKEDENQLKSLRDYWANPELEEGEKFLRDYILNQRYISKDDEVLVDNAMSDSEEETVQKQEEFERKFNFRFEEPDQEFIKRYPRTVEQSMRKKDDKRKKHREELKARKQSERAQKDEELKRLKALKRAEIMEKIKKLQEVTGNDDMTFKDMDIDGDFNPEEHDKRMTELFNEEFYETNVDEKKPEFPDLDEELEIEKWDDWTGVEEAGAEEEDTHCEDPNFVMDCDYDPKAAHQQELVESSRRRKKRRQSKFAEAVSRPKPLFDPKDTNFEKYLDEYYSLNYEDLIGDIPCRFKYRKTVPNDFGLSIEEILTAPDKELNRWVSVKKMMQRRPDHVEQYDVKAYERKARNLAKKMQCLPSIYAPPEEPEEDANPSQVIDALVNNLNNVKVPDRLKKQIVATVDAIPAPSTAIQKDKKNKSKRKVEAIVKVDQSEENHPSPAKIALADSQEPKKKKQKVTSASDQNNFVGPATDTRDTPKSSLPSKKIKRKRALAGLSSESKNTGNSHVEGAGEAKATSKMNRRQKKNMKLKLLKAQQGTKSKELPSKSESSKVKKLRKNQSNRPDLRSSSDNPAAALSAARLKSYGINPKKFMNKIKYGGS